MCRRLISFPATSCKFRSAISCPPTSASSADRAGGPVDADRRVDPGRDGPAGPPMRRAWCAAARRPRGRRHRSAGPIRPHRRAGAGSLMSRAPSRKPYSAVVRNLTVDQFRDRRRDRRPTPSHRNQRAADHAACADRAAVGGAGGAAGDVHSGGGSGRQDAGDKGRASDPSVGVA